MELGPVGDVVGGQPEFQFIMTAAAIVTSSIAFFAPTFYRTRQTQSRGLVELIQIIEANESRFARRNLRKKYEKNLLVSKEDLEKSSQQVRDDLLLIYETISSKSASKTVFQKIYAEIMVETINAYFKFMEEYYPDSEIESEIKKLYKTSFRWYKLKSGDRTKQEIEGTFEDLYEKLGF